MNAIQTLLDHLGLLSPIVILVLVTGAVLQLALCLRKGVSVSSFPYRCTQDRHIFQGHCTQDASGGFSEIIPDGAKCNCGKTTYTCMFSEFVMIKAHKPANFQRKVPQ